MSSTEEKSGDYVIFYSSESPYFTDNDTNYFNTTDEESLTDTLAHPNVILPYSVLLAIAIYLTIVGMFYMTMTNYIRNRDLIVNSVFIMSKLTISFSRYSFNIWKHPIYSHRYTMALFEKQFTYATSTQYGRM